MKRFKKHVKNLKQDGNDIISYTTVVAKIKGNDLIELGKWSVTTSRHVSYAAGELGLNLIRFNG